MKKKLLSIILIVIAVILALSIAEYRSRSASIGIIGGADGPTAILVSRTPITFPFIAGIIAFVLILAGIFLYRRRKSK